jgi:predicted XRE-type DNA-binding protein
MAKSWKNVRSEAVRAGRLDENRVAKHRDDAVVRVRAHRLAELRVANGLNQTAVAERLGIAQSRVSRIERGDLDHTQLATLRAFVGALGGELEIVARIGDQRIQIA